MDFKFLELLITSFGPDQVCNFPFMKETYVKVVGMNWQPYRDQFVFKVELNDKFSYTKREVLSVIARLYDPLGLIGPVIAKAKIFLQKLWIQKLNWDDVLPEEISTGWRCFVSELKDIENLRIPRWILIDNVIRMVLHCFADASEMAFGAAVYAKCYSI